MQPMEPETTPLNLIILFISNRPIMHKVLQFLDIEAITALYFCYADKVNMLQIANHHSNMLLNEENKIISRMLASYLYLRRYMLQVDRSFYYSIYDSHEFQKIQNQQLIKLSQSENGFYQMLLRRQNLMQFVRVILKKAECQEIQEAIQRLVDDPDIPMAKLQRQNVGAGCTSTFQQFLVSIGSDEEQTIINPEFEQLNQFFERRIDEDYIRQIVQSKKHPQILRNLRMLRFAAHQITYENYKHYLLGQNQLHNFIISLFLLAEEHVVASKKYIETIDDPHHKFLEMMLRYSLFRNFIISVQVFSPHIHRYQQTQFQEGFGFAFQAYTQLYEDTIGGSKKFPALTFWRPAFAKWFFNMSKFHAQCHEIFESYLTNSRQQNTLKFLEQCQLSNPALYSKIVNSFELHLTPQSSSSVSELLAEEMQVLVKQYADYIIDISLDQISVHQCGHSQQKLGNPYAGFQKKCLQYNDKYLNYTMFNIKQPSVCSQVLSNDLKFVYENQLVKPVTIAKFISFQHKLLLQNPINYNEIRDNIQEFDSKLEYFNNKNAHILVVKDPYIRQFYKIIPEMSVKDILQISSTTDNTSKLSQIDIYDSDSEQDLIPIQIDIEMEQQNFNEIYKPPSSQKSQQFRNYNQFSLSSQFMQEQSQEQIIQICRNLPDN